MESGCSFFHLRQSVSGALPQEDLTEFMSLAEYLREEVMVNYDKFSMWLETLPNENLVSLVNLFPNCCSCLR